MLLSCLKSPERSLIKFMRTFLCYLQKIASCVCYEKSKILLKKLKTDIVTWVKSLRMSPTVWTSNSDRFSTYTPFVLSSRNYKRKSMNVNQQQYAASYFQVKFRYGIDKLPLNLWMKDQGDRWFVHYKSLKKNICSCIVVSHPFDFPLPEK